MIKEPKVVKEGYAYINEQTEKWCLKENAPEWAVEEFNRIFVKPEPDKNGLVTLR